MIYKDKIYNWPLTRDDLYYFYCQEKLSGGKIADMFGITPGTVSHWKKVHKIKTIECWQRKNLPDQLTAQEKEVILGHVLGDGCISRNSKHAHLRVSQSKKQLDFVEQLYFYLKEWAAYCPVEDNTWDNRHNKIYTTVRFDTFNHPNIDKLYELCYKNGTKTINEEWLKHIDRLGVTVWYEGDGGLCGNLPNIATCSFTRKEHELLVDWFASKWNINVYPKTYDGYTKLYISDRIKFRELIEDFMIPYFNYKLPRPKKVRSKLSDYDVSEIFKMSYDGFTSKDIAEKFKISSGYVGNIINKKRLVRGKK
jgi:DNA-binding CsgD family transcriptional regulator